MIKQHRKGKQICSLVSNSSSTSSSVMGSLRSSRSNGTNNSYHSSFKNQAKIGLFGDIHFQDVGLERVVETGEWITKEFEKQKVDYVVCLGDVLNTRETVSIKAQSSALQFFDKLAQKIPKEIHIICGNHDLNLKYDTKVSSLDALGMSNVTSNRIHLHKHITERDFDGKKVVLIPYYEDSSTIRDWVVNKISKEPLDNSIGFCHMAINGAIQRYQKDSKNNVYSRSYDDHAGKNILVEKKKKKNGPTGGNDHMDLPDEGSKVPKFLTQFQRVFSGHFHHHHFCDKKVAYAGAPMQHHFGDSGDSARGVVIYDTETDEIQFIQNPEWDKFRILRLSKEEDIGDITEYTGKHVSVIYESFDLVPQVIQDKLLKAGASSVKKHSVVVRKVQSVLSSDDHPKEEEKAFTGQMFEDFVVKYVKQYANLSSLGYDSQFTDNVIKIGKEIISESTKEDNNNLNVGDTFKANIKSITIQNFLGVRGCITFEIKNMQNGIWFLEGSNGAGKSTILEALTWCLFDKFLRSDMKADYVVNDSVKKDCLVRVDFESGYSIERFRKYTKSGEKELPDEITATTSSGAPERKGTGIRVFNQGQYLSDYEKGSTRDSQTSIESLIGINFDMFTKAIVVGDNAVNFLTSDAKQRRDLIEDLLGLYLFDSYLSKTREKKKSLIEKVYSMKSAQEKTQSSITSLEESLKRSKEQLVNIDSTLSEKEIDYSKSVLLCNELAEKKKLAENNWKQFQRLFIAKQNYSNLVKKKEQLESRISALEKTLDSLSKERDSYYTATTTTTNGITSSSSSGKDLEISFDLKLDEIRTSLKKLSQNSMETSVELNVSREKLGKLVDLSENNECPYCEQPIKDHTHEKIVEEKTSIESRVEELTHNAEIVNYEIYELQQQLEHLEKAKKSTMQTFNKLENTIVLNQKQKEGLENDLANVTIFTDNAEKELKNLLSFESEDVEATLNNLVSQERKALQQQYELDANIKFSKKRKSELERDVEMGEKSLGELYLDLQTVSTSYKDYEQDFSSLEFWEKAFDKKSKKSARDEFETMRSFLLNKSIEDLNNILDEYSKLVGSDLLKITFDSDLMIKEDYGKRSSGQRKRNHLMIHFALFELVRQRSRFRSNFLMLDEVFDALDVNGQAQVQQVIEMISAKVDKVFVISHSTSNMELRKKAIVASMSDEGSKYKLTYR